MKSLTRYGAVFVLFALATSMTYAGRPQCGEVNRPGVCFYDDANYSLVSIWRADSATAYAVVWASNDFCQVRPDGTNFCASTDATADLYVCPTGGVQCLTDWWNNALFPAPLPGMYVGKAQFSTAGLLTQTYDFYCPLTAHARGTASDADGNAYAVTDNFIQLKNPGPAGECYQMINLIQIVPK